MRLLACFIGEKLGISRAVLRLISRVKRSLKINTQGVMEAEEYDIDALVHYRVELFREMGKITPDIDLDAFKDELYIYYKKHLNVDHIAWVYKEDGEIVAISGMNILSKPPRTNNFTGREAYIMNIYVAPSYRRKGIAKSLMDQLLEDAKSRGINDITLIASEKGQPLYEAMGFVKSTKNIMELS